MRVWSRQPRLGEWPLVAAGHPTHGDQLLCAARDAEVS
jgi:hypothetical protein